MALIHAVLAVVGAVLVALGAALVSLSLGLVVGGVECITAGYVGAYLKAKGGGA